jgi:AcrR family transcriptional regulator
MKADNRTRLLRAAEKTTYRYGFGSTWIADMAKEARIPLGNVYYYFKTKDDIRALARLRSTAGVQLAAITDNMPLTGENSVYSVYRQDNPLPESAVPTANLRNITPDYFATMQIPLDAGEDFGEKEREHPEDAIVSQKLAKAAWPGEDPLGRKFRINGRTYTVLGIAADARIVDLKQSVPVVYLPYWHDPSPNVFFLVRSSLPLGTLAPSAQSVGEGPYAVEGFDGPTSVNLPAFCRVTGHIRPSADSDIYFEVWMPGADWNGRFEAVGNTGRMFTFAVRSNDFGTCRESRRAQPRRHDSIAPI